MYKRQSLDREPSPPRRDSTFLAVRRACFGPSLLDGFHGHHAFGQFLLTQQVLGESANVLEWAFRLYRRSRDDTQADPMRAWFVSVVISGCGRLWTLDLGESDESD